MLSQNSNITRLKLKDWKPDAKRKDLPHQADYCVITNGKRLKFLKCKVFHEFEQGLYYRIGFKFIGRDNFGEDNIQSIDDNILVHTGIGSTSKRLCNELFTALYVRGKRPEERSVDQFTGIELKNNKGYEIWLSIDENDFLSFKIDGKEFEK